MGDNRAEIVNTITRTRFIAVSFQYAHNFPIYKGFDMHQLRNRSAVMSGSYDIMNNYHIFLYIFIYYDSLCDRSHSSQAQLHGLKKLVKIGPSKTIVSATDLHAW